MVVSDEFFWGLAHSGSFWCLDVLGCLGTCCLDPFRRCLPVVLGQQHFICLTGPETIAALQELPGARVIPTAWHPNKNQSIHWHVVQNLLDQVTQGRPNSFVPPSSLSNYIRMLSIITCQQDDKRFDYNYNNGNEHPKTLVMKPDLHEASWLHYFLGKKWKSWMLAPAGAKITYS